MEKTPDNPGGRAKPSRWGRVLLVLLVVSAIVAVRAVGLQQFLEKEQLRQLIGGYGWWGPLIYLLVWLLAPPLFLPGLPITLAGGVLFGPFWGVVYTITGATGGATLAFLVARYLARDWVAAQLAGTKLATLDAKVGEQGWKILAFTRLIPLFPFNLLNYAFGLTRISLPAYIVTSLIFMLPMTVAYVYFSANILDLLRGEVSRELLLGLVLVLLVTFIIPAVWRRRQAKEPGA